MNKIGNQKTFGLKEAITLARHYHKGQKDLQGVDYFMHLKNVTRQLKGTKFKIAGYLHDIVEDTDITYSDLTKLGCSLEIVNAIKLLTHKKLHLTRDEFLDDMQNIVKSKNQIAIDVKWADITHNSDMSRIKVPIQKDWDRYDKYMKAKDILRPHVSPYLNDKSS